MNKIKDFFVNRKEDITDLFSAYLGICVMLILGKIFVSNFTYIIVIAIVLFIASRFELVIKTVKRFIKKSVNFFNKKFNKEG
jgi:hypothetical protein